MKHQLALAAILLSCATSAFAQRGNNFNNNNNNNNNRNGQNQNRNGRNGGGTLPLPEGVNRVISIDAYNVLLAESQGDNGGESIYTPIVIRHGYSGGYAALYGGTSIPTDQFVSPGTQNNGGGGFGGGFGGGRGGIGGIGGGFNQGGIGGGFNTGIGGFNQGGIGGGFNQGFNQGFNGGGFNQGFNNGFSQGFNGNFAMSQSSVTGANGQQIPLQNAPIFVR